MNPKLSAVSWTIIVVSWLLFTASFFMSAHSDLGRIIRIDRSPPTGWSSMVENCWYVSVRPVVLIIEPRLVGFLVIPFANLFVFISPLLAYAAEGNCRPIAFPLLAFTAVAWFMPLDFHDGLLFGFYTWNLSPIGIATGILLLSSSRACQSSHSSGRAVRIGKSITRHSG